MNIWKRLPITLQFMLLLLLVTTLGVLCIHKIGSRLSVAEAREQARTVADLVDNLGTWASQYKGIWVRKDPTNLNMQVGSFLERDVAHTDASHLASPSADPMLAVLSDARAIVYHHKNPALVQRELADVIHASNSKVKFRMTSDRYMNPDNAPTEFELAAIDQLRTSGHNEYAEVHGDEMLYARKLIAAPGCLSCHSTPEKAPIAVTSQYGTTNGYGYKEGEVAGIISVTVPLDYHFTDLVRDFDWRTWTLLAIFVMSALLLMLHVQFGIARPIKKLRVAAEAAASRFAASSTLDPSSQLEGSTPPDEKNAPAPSANEVQRLRKALKALLPTGHSSRSRH